MTQLLHPNSAPRPPRTHTKVPQATTFRSPQSPPMLPSKPPPSPSPPTQTPPPPPPPALMVKVSPANPRLLNLFAIQLKKLYRAMNTLKTKAKEEDADEIDDSGQSPHHPPDAKTTRPRRKSGGSGSTITSGQLFFSLLHTHTCLYLICLSLIELTRNLLIHIHVLHRSS
jgi:hypothetical protein